MPCEELDIVWNNIKAEARALADCETDARQFFTTQRYSSMKISAAR